MTGGPLQSGPLPPTRRLGEAKKSGERRDRARMGRDKERGGGVLTEKYADDERHRHASPQPVERRTSFSSGCYSSTGTRIRAFLGRTDPSRSLPPLVPAAGPGANHEFTGLLLRGDACAALISTPRPETVLRQRTVGPLRVPEIVPARSLGGELTLGLDGGWGEARQFHGGRSCATPAKLPPGGGLTPGPTSGLIGDDAPKQGSPPLRRRGCPAPRWPQGSSRAPGTLPKCC